jgi:hypothetical protein
MADELVFEVNASEAVAAKSVSFAEAGLREREHFQEWVISNPEILGPNVMIVTAEFDRWIASSGQPTYDRLDVLGLDDAGHLIVAELKRDRAPDSVTMQALNYAAMVSRFSLDELSNVLVTSRLESALTPEDALTELQGFAPGISDETLGAPRIHLLASDFGPAVTNLALYLYENGIDIRLSRVQPYQTADGRYIVTVSRILPVPNAEDFMVRPRSGNQARSKSTLSDRESWDWKAFEEKLNMSEERITIAKQLVEDLDAEISRRKLPWTKVFRKGYVAFNRAGGFNVVGVDLMWKKPVRLFLTLPSGHEDQPELKSPFPDLSEVWAGYGKQWGWHVDKTGDVKSMSDLVDMAEQVNG